LCRNFIHERRRLLHRNILDMFKEDFEKIYERINNYSQYVKDNEPICNLPIQYMYVYDNGHRVILNGEIDMYDSKNKMIVNFKCSESGDCKLEWITQSLLYYSMIKSNSRINEMEIQKFAIFNIMNGKQYEYNIPTKFNHELLLEYFKNIIGKDLNNDRKSIQEILNLESLLTNKIEKVVKIEKNEIKININDNPKNYICFDVETNMQNEIVQLAYEIYDENLIVIKTCSNYVKDRSVTKQSTMIHGITNEMLDFGIDFTDIIKEFLIDLNDAKYVVGHNIQFDIKRVICDMQKFNINTNLMDPFENKVIQCTMNMSKKICNFKKSDGNIKPPKLGELYKFYYGKDMKNAHNAIYDVKYTWLCYLKIIG